MSDVQHREKRTGLRHLPPYPKYKDSRVEWLGEIPAHWEVVRADAFLRYEKIQVEPSGIADEIVFHYSIPLVQETGDGAIEPPSEINSAKLKILGQRLLVSKLNPRKGVVLIVSQKGVPTLCSTEFVPFEARGVEIRWALYLFLAESTRQRISAAVRSATRSHQRAEVSEVAKMWHGVPPVSEQIAIAAFLDRETAKIDALVEKKERLIELLEEKRTALITQAVTKGLDPNVPMKDSGVEWLGEIPTHWEVKRLKTIAPLCINKLDAKPGDAAYIGLEHVESWTGRLMLDNQPEGSESAVASFRAGDVLFGKLRPYLAKAARPAFDGVCTSELLPLRPGRWYSQSYVMYSLLNAPFIHWLNSMTYGTKMPRVSPQQVGNSSTPVPPASEQSAIADYLDRETAKIDALVSKVREAIERLKELRTSLISAAVTGKIDVREEV